MHEIMGPESMPPDPDRNPPPPPPLPSAMELAVHDPLRAPPPHPLPQPGPSLPPAPRPDVEPVLRTLGLTRRFGSLAAVRDLSLTVRRGEIYGFLGRNGAGKTTTIRMLMGIVAPDRGKIELLGEQVRRTPPRLKRRIGYVSQEQNFYAWMDARRLGQFVGAFYPDWDAPEFARLLQVLDVPVGRRVGQLSGGTRVKLGLALALAHRPELLILDEPTAGLDPVSRREFLDIVVTQARNHGRTTFFSTHRIEEVERIAHRVGVIHDGALEYEGGLDELRRTIRSVARPIPAGGSGMPALPDGCRVLQRLTQDGGPDAPAREHLVVRAEPSWWPGADFGPGAVISDLSLEDTLMAIAGRSSFDL